MIKFFLLAFELLFLDWMVILTSMLFYLSCKLETFSWRKVKYHKVEQIRGLRRWCRGKESACQCRRRCRPGFIPGSGRPLGGRNGNCSSILAWKILWTEEPGRLQSMRLQSQTWQSNRGHSLKSCCILWSKRQCCFRGSLFFFNIQEWGLSAQFRMFSGPSFHQEGLSFKFKLKYLSGTQTLSNQPVWDGFQSLADGRDGTPSP